MSDCDENELWVGAGGEDRDIAREFRDEAREIIHDSRASDSDRQGARDDAVKWECRRVGGPALESWRAKYGKRRT